GGHIGPFGVGTAGRWSCVRGGTPLPEEAVAEAVAGQLLRRYGVVFRRLVTRETLLTPWRDILRVYRRLEARGEIRGGRLGGGFSGEQVALLGAVGVLWGWGLARVVACRRRARLGPRVLRAGR